MVNPVPNTAVNSDRAHFKNESPGKGKFVVVSGCFQPIFGLVEIWRLENDFLRVFVDYAVNEDCHYVSPIV
jgi:hypothetical protein